jgi:uncharacterized protein
MFPLSAVVVPGMLIPLHVFEPRYRRLVHDCQAGDGTFGVVLIERGSEVGGGDVRTDVGTLVRIVQAEELSDGRWVLAVAGVQRIQVERWYDDDPYPRAEITKWPDVPASSDATQPSDAARAPTTDEPGSAASADVRREVTTLLRRAAALSREIGEPAPPLDLELDDDAVAASYQAIALSPLGPVDRQGLLAAPTLEDRWTSLRELLAGQIDLLESRLAGS